MYLCVLCISFVFVLHVCVCVFTCSYLCLVYLFVIVCLCVRALNLLLPVTSLEDVNDSGMSPLHSAAAGGHTHCIKVCVLVCIMLI